MEINLEIIKTKAGSLKEENHQFKRFLKSIPTKKIDILVADLNRKISSAIDCTACANCCKILEPPVHKHEIDRLSNIKNVQTEIFELKYVGKESSTHIQFLKCQPCIFLQENKCGVYEFRPTSCADYPHLTQPNFKYRWKSVMTNYALCPIVYNVVEHLKKELNYIQNHKP